MGLCVGGPWWSSHHRSLGLLLGQGTNQKEKEGRMLCHPPLLKTFQRFPAVSENRPTPPLLVPAWLSPLLPSQCLGNRSPLGLGLGPALLLTDSPYCPGSGWRSLPPSLTFWAGVTSPSRCLLTVSSLTLHVYCLCPLRECPCPPLRLPDSEKHLAHDVLTGCWSSGCT